MTVREALELLADKQIQVEVRRYLVNQKVERVTIIHEAKFIGLNIIAAMRMVAQE